LKIAKEDIYYIFAKLDIHHTGKIKFMDFCMAVISLKDLFVKDCIKVSHSILDYDSDRIITLEDIK
jgi:hypothetical protein